MSTHTFDRSAINLARREITLSYLRPGSPLPLVVRPAAENVDLVAWAAANTEFIEEYLLRNGAILFREFELTNVARFERLIETVCGPLLDYSYRSMPRHVVSGRIYSSTEYPAHQTIPLHNENSYTRNWPMKLSFFAVQVAEQGGETPIADCRKVYEKLPAEILKCFVRKGLMYVRNYGTGLDIPWQEAFQTNNKAMVEEYCRKAGMDYEWVGLDQFRTRQTAHVVETHPRTGETVWFNQAHLFHVSRLPLEVREWLLKAYGEQNLPRNVYFADGSTIDPAMLDEINETYTNASVVFPWNEGDLLMLDNMLTAHGRKPFVGKRKVVVGIAESNRGLARTANAVR
ncbi:MAG TPA: TauD/TfdA family dioxygenase [Pyrinomonadaceae bacterium]|nr:TauD/TfdA family dioxygenase [Pyrinomonadaceae bacterium]